MGHVNLAVRETRTVRPFVSPRRNIDLADDASLMKDEDTKPANLKKGILSLFKELEEHRPKSVSCLAIPPLARCGG